MILKTFEVYDTYPTDKKYNITGRRWVIELNWNSLELSFQERIGRVWQPGTSSYYKLKLTRELEFGYQAYNYDGSARSYLELGFLRFSWAS